MGKEGERGQKDGETKTFGFICRSGQKKSFGTISLHGFTSYKHHGVICSFLFRKRKKKKHNYSLFLQLRPFYRLRYSQSQRWEVNSGLTLWFKQGTRPGSFRKIATRLLSGTCLPIVESTTLPMAVSRLSACCGMEMSDLLNGSSDDQTHRGRAEWTSNQEICDIEIH